MANPRKFSEKIALHNQKQAEETAEFEKIMKEVSDATNKPTHEQLRGGHGQERHIYRERPRSAVGPIRPRPVEKRIDTSPYSGSYLSPPLDNPWRRTHSDSSLHTSSHDPHQSSHRRGVTEYHSQNMEEYEPMKRSFSCTPEGRPRSALDMPRVPGIPGSMYPSQQEAGTIQIPIVSNTGSLPDLSSFHMTSPLDVPLDHEEAHFINNSHCGSPRSLSPTHLVRNSRLAFSTAPSEAPGPPQLINHMDRSPRQMPHQQRPSPQMSPQLQVNFKYANQSPSSSPQSPPSPTSSVCKMSPLDPTYYSQDHVTLQHHFEQFSMSEESCTKLTGSELTPDLGYYSNSPQYTRLQPETSSNTPSSIPDIIFTDCSNGEDLGKDIIADLDECLREDLVPIDIDGMQMLEDPTNTNIIADPATEDHLRLDRF